MYNKKGTKHTKILIVLSFFTFLLLNTWTGLFTGLMTFLGRIIFGETPFDHLNVPQTFFFLFILFFPYAGAPIMILSSALLLRRDKLASGSEHMKPFHRKWYIVIIVTNAAFFIFFIIVLTILPQDVKSIIIH